MQRRIFLLLCIFAALATGLRADDFKFPLKPDSVRFAVIGDMGTGEQPQYETAQQMLKARQSYPFDFAIMLGDNIYGSSKPVDFDHKFALPYKPFLDAGVSFYASLGNHDDTNEIFYKPFNMNGESYYTYKKGNVRFFVLNSNYMDPKQLAWFETQLQSASKSDWKVCYFHHPLYTSAKFHGPSLDLRRMLEPLFIKYGVDVVFSGHEHVYERVHPQNGIYYFTEGASGSLRPGNLRQSTITDKGFDTDRTFMLIEIAGEEMFFQTIARTGETVDSGVIHRTAR